MFTNICNKTVTPLLLRMMLASIFIFHGLDLVGGEGHQGGANWNPDLPAAAQLAVAWGQLLGGIALALGLLTRLAALGIIVIMGGAIATVHWPHGFNGAKGGFEYNAAIIVMCLCLVIGGPGPIAIDRVLRLRRR
jgi:putative oxidoreductase